ncbi:hypothetical protein ACFPN2_28470 [Steroidobacter flavus]|uniref:Uncharacterized protein n=1 Tax=Steroidobacter flavus TaxID=1842136 RepID=A0ABV8T1W5_9GAMM
MPTKRIAAFLVACLVAALTPLASPKPAPVVTANFPGWPTTFEGRPLRALELTDIEERFVRSFPGRIGRFSDGRREIVLRWIAAPTRKLHAASDCFKGSGYHVTPLPLQTTDGNAWGAFSAERHDQRLNVREAIVDASGRRWTDVSAWYWAAVRDETRGPWWAITVAAAGSSHASAANVPLAAAEE